MPKGAQSKRNLLELSVPGKSPEPQTYISIDGAAKKMNIANFKTLISKYTPLAEALNDLQGKPKAAICAVRVFNDNGRDIDERTELHSVDWRSTRIEFSFADSDHGVSGRRTPNAVLDELQRSDLGERWPS